MRVKSLLHLAMVCPGNTVRLAEIRGGHCMRKRLADLGLNTGDLMVVVQACERGPMILKVKDSRLAIGRGVAHHIMVEYTEEDAVPVEEGVGQISHDC